MIQYLHDILDSVFNISHFLEYKSMWTIGPNGFFLNGKKYWLCCKNFELEFIVLEGNMHKSKTMINVFGATRLITRKLLGEKVS